MAWLDAEASILFTLFYALFSVCFVFQSKEFSSAGLSPENILGMLGWLGNRQPDGSGSEELKFLNYHIRKVNRMPNHMLEIKIAKFLDYCEKFCIYMIKYLVQIILKFPVLIIYGLINFFTDGRYTSFACLHSFRLPLRLYIFCFCRRSSWAIL